MADPRYREELRRQLRLGLNVYRNGAIGLAGMTEAEARKSGKPALIATMQMEDVSRAFEKGETNGFMKILVERGR